MNFTTLRYFVCAAEEMNISQAAKKLFMSQQTLSNRINRLEEELHVKLFSRTPHLSLTYTGKIVFQLALQILDLEKQIYTRIEDIHDEKAGQLNIGLTRVRARAILPKILPAYSEMYPKIQVNAVLSDNADIQQKLQSGELDLAIVNNPPERSNTVRLPLFKDNFCVIVPQKFIPLRDAALNFKQEDLNADFWFNTPLLLSKGTHVRATTDLFFRARNIIPNVLIETTDIETLFSLSECGMGVTFSYEKYAQKQLASLDSFGQSSLRIISIDDDTLCGHIKVVYRKDRYLSRAAQRFIDLARERLNEPSAN